MLITIHGAREHLASLTELANYLGVKPFETPTKDIIGKLLDSIEDEVERYYFPVPFDADTHPIQVGDMLKEYGYVHGIGHGCVFAGDKTYEDGYVQYAVYPANTAHIKRVDGASLIELVTQAVNDGTLSDAKISLLTYYIEGIYDVVGETS